MNIGVPHKLTVYHVVGLGKGLACEGWLDGAVRFWISQQSWPLPFSAPDKDKTASTHTTKFTDIPVEFVLCVRFFVAIFAQ